MSTPGVLPSIIGASGPGEQAPGVAAPGGGGIDPRILRILASLPKAPSMGGAGAPGGVVFPGSVGTAPPNIIGGVGGPGSPGSGATLGLPGSQGPAAGSSASQPVYISSRNRALKNVAVAGNFLQNIGNAVTAFKQKQFDKRRQQSAGAMGQLINMQQAIAGLQQDPDFKTNPDKQKAVQSLTQQMTQMASDPKFTKAWDKAQKDPSSAEYQGFAFAKKQAEQDAAQKLAAAETQAKIAQAQETAKAEAQRAKLLATQQGRLERGEADPNVIAEVAGRQKVAEIQSASRNAHLTKGPTLINSKDGSVEIPFLNAQGKLDHMESVVGIPLGALPTQHEGYVTSTVQDPSDPTKSLVIRVPISTTSQKILPGGPAKPPEAAATKKAANHALSRARSEDKSKPDNIGLPKGTKIIGDKPLNPFQIEKLQEGIVAYDSALKSLRTIRQNSEVFNSLWTSGKIALASDDAGRAVFSRAGKLTDQESTVAAAMQVVTEQINLARTPFGGAGFRSVPAWNALQGLHGKIGSPVDVMNKTLDSTIEFFQKTRDTKSKLVEPRVKPEGAGAGSAAPAPSATKPTVKIAPDGSITISPQ